MARRKMRPGAAIVLVALLGLFLGVVYQLSGSFFGKEVEVPYIVGMSIKEADDELTKVGLKLKIMSEQYDNEVEKDHIISQQFVKGFKVKKGREIGAIVSKGTQLHKVPRVVGMERSEAELQLRNEGFQVGKVDPIYDDKYAENFVISQNPTGNSEAEAGAFVDLMISKGNTPKRIPMPDLIGMKLGEATQKLKENNLEVGEVSRQESTTFYADQVIDQDTQSGVMVDEKTSINLIVSKGPGPTAQTRTLEFTLPQEQDFYKVVINIQDASGNREVYNELHRGGDQIVVGVRYFGNAQANIQLNGKPYRSVKL